MDYHQLFDHSPVPLLVLDAQSWTPLLFNRLACEYMGYSEVEFRRLTITDFELRPNPRETHEHVRRILGMRRDSFSALHRAKDGSPRRVGVDLTVVRWGGRDAMLTAWHDLSRHPVRAHPIQSASNGQAPSLEHPARLDAAMRAHVLRTLESCRWVIEGPRGAALHLGLRPSTLRSKMERLGIERPIDPTA